MTKLMIVLPLALLMLASCGRKGGSSSSHRSTSPISDDCTIKLSAGDEPSIVALKAYRTQYDCKIQDEDQIIAHLVK